jgi:hypothetical protein
MSKNSMMIASGISGLASGMANGIQMASSIDRMRQNRDLMDMRKEQHAANMRIAAMNEAELKYKGDVDREREQQRAVLGALYEIQELKMPINDRHREAINGYLGTQDFSIDENGGFVGIGKDGEQFSLEPEMVNQWRGEATKAVKTHSDYKAGMAELEKGEKEVQARKKRLSELEALNDPANADEIRLERMRIVSLSERLNDLAKGAEMIAPSIYTDQRNVMDQAEMEFNQRMRTDPYFKDTGIMVDDRKVAQDVKGMPRGAGRTKDVRGRPGGISRPSKSSTATPGAESVKPPREILPGAGMQMPRIAMGPQGAAPTQGDAPQVSATPAASDMVPVIAPDGTPVRLPKARVDEFITKHGFKLSQ